MDTTQFDADLSLSFSIFAEDARFDWDPHLRYAREQTLNPPDLTARYFRVLTQLRGLLGPGPILAIYPLYLCNKSALHRDN